MNTRIARSLNEARHNVAPAMEIKRIGEEVTMAHNIAVTNGFLELPILEFVDAERQDHAIVVDIRPRSGMMDLNDLYNLKTAWGADDVNVLTADKSIELVFKK